MKNQGTIDEFVGRLKIRYSQNNPVLDLLLLIEMLRQENQEALVSKTDVKDR